MIRVLHFVSTPSIGSGVMSVIMNYYRNIDRSKLQFDFLCFIPCKDSYIDEIERLGGHVFFVLKPGSSMRSVWELRNFFCEREGEYQFFHNHEVYLSFILKPMTQYYGIPHFIIHAHATKYSDRKFAAIRNAVLCMPIRFMKCERFACSLAAAEFLYGKKQIRSREVKIFYNAINIQAYQFEEQRRIEIRKALGIDGDAQVIGHVGRFTPQKNHEFVMRVYSEYRKQNEKSKLICVGEGALKRDIEALANEYGIADDVIFLGQRQDVADLLNAMDVFLLPSVFEGFPVALVEAVSNGLNCLVSDTIADEIVSKQVKRLSLEQSPKVWADTLWELSSRTEVNNDETYLLDKSYDILYQAKCMQEFYLNER